MLGFSEEIVSRVNLHYFLLISGSATLILCFALRTKNINFTISLMYYNDFVFKIVAEILLLPLVLRNLIVIWALDYRCCQTISEFYYQYCKGVQLLKKRLKLIQYFKSKIGSCGLLFLQETLQSNTFMVKFSFLTEKQILAAFWQLFSELINLPLRNYTQTMAAVF